MSHSCVFHVSLHVSGKSFSRYASNRLYEHQTVMGSFCNERKLSAIRSPPLLLSKFILYLSYLFRTNPQLEKNSLSPVISKAFRVILLPSHPPEKFGLVFKCNGSPR